MRKYGFKPIPSRVRENTKMNSRKTEVHKSVIRPHPTFSKEKEVEEYTDSLKVTGASGIRSTQKNRSEASALVQETTLRGNIKVSSNDDPDTQESETLIPCKKETVTPHSDSEVTESTGGDDMASHSCKIEKPRGNPVGPDKQTNITTRSHNLKALIKTADQRGYYVRYGHITKGPRLDKEKIITYVKLPQLVDMSQSSNHIADILARKRKIGEVSRSGQPPLSQSQSESSQRDHIVEESQETQLNEIPEGTGSRTVKLPKDDNGSVKKKRKYSSGKLVYTPDMRFPFTQPDREESGDKVEGIPTFSTGEESSTSSTFPPSEETGRETQNKTLTITGRKKKNRKRKRNQPVYSETTQHRLLRVYMKVLDCHGNIRRVKVALDTQSNISYAKRDLGIKRSWNSGECRLVKGLGGLCEETFTPLTTRVIKGTKVININTRTPPSTLFTGKNDPEILLCTQHCASLKIDLNSILSNLRHRDVIYLDEDEEPATKKVCLIAEKLMLRYLEKTGGSDKEPKQCSIEDVEISDDFTQGQKRRVKDICREYKDVFASSPDEIPPPMKDAEPHVFKMKEGIKPIYCKRPNWGPAQRRYLEQWTKKAIKQGLLEPAPNSQWASRPVLVGKYRGQTAKGDVPDGIRTCVDFTAVNEFIMKQPPQYTDPFEEIRKASGHEFYFEADGQKQFNSILLDPSSRDVTTTWTPLGLMRWKRLIMGTKDASARAQQEYSKSMSKYLSQEERDHISNFQDDFLGFHDDISKLLDIFRGFLKMCHRAGITLNPAKIRIGIRKCKFYGFILSKKGIEPAEKNLDPVDKMTIPTNRSEVRSVMGVFNQFRHFFKRFDRLVLPIQKLLKKNEKFLWTKEANRGFEIIKEKLLSGEIYLSAQDKTRPLVLETDGSDDGWGAILLQIIDGNRQVLKMWSKQWTTLHMRRAPPYYKETAAWMNGLEKARIYADYSKFPIECVTDHIPLTFVKSTSGKGPVSQFVLDNLSFLDYTITYREGRKLVEADAVSRFPCLGPKTLAPDGVKEAFNVLLASLPDTWTSEGRVWVFAQKETELIQQMVRQWMSMLPKSTSPRKVPFVESPTKDRIEKIDYSLGLWVPTAEQVQEVINTAMDKGRPFACLVPSCLVNLLPQGKKNKNIMKNSIKLVLLQPELTWIIHSINSITQHQVFPSMAAVNTFGNLNDFRGIVRGHPNWNLKEWVPKQESMRLQHTETYPEEKIHRRESDGFLLFKNSSDQMVALVPPEHVDELVTWQHHSLCHAGHAKVHSAIVKHWHWPGMKSQIRKIVTDCAACQLLKAKRARAHRHFRAKVFCTPRTSWGMDFYAVAESKEGYKQILGAIDLATAEVRLFACKLRTAAVVTDCVLHGIVLRDGCPLHIHTDAAKEFVSKAMQRLSLLLGCKQTTTLAHHPTGNANIERLWQWVAACLRIMTKEQYHHWEDFVRLIEHVWNTTFHSVLQCTPFEAAHGLPARGVIESLVQDTARNSTRLMTSDSISAMRDTAKAFEKQIQLLRTEAAERNAALNSKGPGATYKVGDKVSLFLPPTEKEAKEMGRKPKHLLTYKGPAKITKILSKSTYQLEYEGRVFYRCFSELRPYKSSKLPIDLPIANDRDMQVNKLKIGNFVTLCDSNSEHDVHFHLCKVVAIEDNKGILLNYATWGKHLSTAKFDVMYQDKNSRYTTEKPKHNAKQFEVIDKVTFEEADDYIDHYDVKLTSAMRISAKCRKQLAKLGLKHHVLGNTFP